MEELAKIDASVNVPDKSRTRDRPEKTRNRKRKLRRFAFSSLDELTRIADEAHKVLEQKGSPFRLYIYEKDGDIFIDVVTLDTQGNRGQVFRQDITHQELEELILHIKTGRGLVFNASA